MDTKSLARKFPRSGRPDLFRRQVLAALVKDEPGHPALRVQDEIDLVVRDLEEVPRLRLREELDLGLPGRLGDELVAPAGARSDILSKAGERDLPESGDAP
jgi:hypothetical protein